MIVRRYHRPIINKTEYWEMEIVCNEWLFLDCMQNTVTKLPIFDFQFLNAYNLIESLIIVPLIYIFIDSSDVWMCSGDMKKYIRNRQNEFIINQLRRIVNSSWWINTSFWLIINSLWWIINTFRWITISCRCFQFYFFISLTSFRSVESWILFLNKFDNLEPLEVSQMLIWSL